QRARVRIGRADTGQSGANEWPIAGAAVLVCAGGEEVRVIELDLGPMPRLQFGEVAPGPAPGCVESDPHADDVRPRNAPLASRGAAADQCVRLHPPLPLAA